MLFLVYYMRRNASLPYTFEQMFYCDSDSVGLVRHGYIYNKTFVVCCPLDIARCDMNHLTNISICVFTGLPRISWYEITYLYRGHKTSFRFKMNSVMNIFVALPRRDAFRNCLFFARLLNLNQTISRRKWTLCYLFCWRHAEATECIVSQRALSRTVFMDLVWPDQGLSLQFFLPFLACLLCDRKFEGYNCYHWTIKIEKKINSTVWLPVSTGSYITFYRLYLGLYTADQRNYPTIPAWKTTKLYRLSILYKINEFCAIQLLDLFNS